MFKTGNRVRINCPNPSKFSSFSNAFHGAQGKIFGIPEAHPTLARVELDSKVHITVEQNWLSHDRP